MFVFQPLVNEGFKVILLVAETRTLKYQISTSEVLVVRHRSNLMQIGLFNRAYSELLTGLKSIKTDPL